MIFMNIVFWILMTLIGWVKAIFKNPIKKYIWVKDDGILIVNAYNNLFGRN